MHVFFCSTGNLVAIKKKAKESIKSSKKKCALVPGTFAPKFYTFAPWSTKTIESDLGTFHTDFDVQCVQAKPVSIKTKHVSIEKLP